MCLFRSSSFWIRSKPSATVFWFCRSSDSKLPRSVADDTFAVAGVLAALTTGAAFLALRRFADVAREGRSSEAGTREAGARRLRNDFADLAVRLRPLAV